MDVNQNSTIRKKVNSKYIIGFLLILGLIFIVFGNNRNKPNTDLDSPKSITETGGDTAPVKDPTIIERKIFTVTGSNFKFEPNVIEVNKGDRIRIIFKNVEGYHTFVIDKYGVKTKILEKDQEDMIEFIAYKIGTFEYYSSIGKQREDGMVGTLIVK